MDKVAPQTDTIMIIDDLPDNRRIRPLARLVSIYEFQYILRWRPS